DHGGVTFVDLRDASGVVQVVFREAAAAHELRNEYCVTVTGTVGRRPAGNENPDLPTGAVEVTATGLTVLSEAAPLPLPVDDHVARCYRDEDFRADRQPEFTQLDIEMSFVTQDDVIDLGEAIVSALWAELAGHAIPRPIPRITWHDAMQRYGSDKPDLRYGLELTELTDYLTGTQFRVFAGAIEAGGYVGAVVMPGGAAQTRKELDAWQDWAKARGARGLAYVVLDAETGEPRGPVAKNLSAEHLAGLADAVGAKPGDAIFFAASADRREAPELLGAARQEIARRTGVVDPDSWSFCWVVDAPMFEPAESPDGRPGWTAVHHPFTSPNAEWLQRFETAPDRAPAYAD